MKSAVLAYISALLIVVGINKETLAAENEAAKQSAVEIYDHDKHLLGTGVLISFSGIILTAKHILEDKDTLGSRAPNYYLKVWIRTNKAHDYDAADVVTIHPYMDLAALLRQGGGPAAPLPVAAAANIENIKGSQALLVGHKIRQDGSNELYKESVSAIDEIDRHGFIIVGKGVDIGTSGGPVLVGNTVVGIIVATNVQKTTALPVHSALSYLRMMGINFSSDGYGIASDNIGNLLAKVPDYERLLTDLQVDVDWLLELIPIQGEQGQSYPFKDIALRLSYRKNLLSTQPFFDCHVSLSATPFFKSKDEPNVIIRGTKGFTRADWLKADRGSITFENFIKDFESLMNERELAERISIENFLGFDVSVDVKSISSAAFLQTPEDIRICFHLKHGGGMDDQFSGTMVMSEGYLCGGASQ